MRTPIEIYTKHVEDTTGDKLFAVHHKNEFILKLIEQAQTEAWNEAIEAAAENCKLYSSIHRFNTEIIEKSSILKLKL